MAKFCNEFLSLMASVSNNHVLLVHVSPLRLSNMAQWLAVNDLRKESPNAVISFLQTIAKKSKSVTKSACKHAAKTIAKCINKPKVFLEMFLHLRVICPDMTFEMFVEQILVPARLNTFKSELEVEWKYKIATFCIYICSNSSMFCFNVK